MVKEKRCSPGVDCTVFIQGTLTNGDEDEGPLMTPGLPVDYTQTDRQSGKPEANPYP